MSIPLPTPDPRSRADRPPVVLVITDTLRSDMFRDEALLERLPTIQRLVRESTVFDRAYATSHWTLPSHGSILTGLLPSEHGASPPTMRLRDDVPTIAEVFRNHGYRTGLVSCNAFLTPVFGMTRGFDRVWDPPLNLTTLSFTVADRVVAPAQEAGGRGGVRALAEAALRLVGSTPRSDNGGRAAVESAASFVARQGPPPFLMVNLMEAHSPYHARGAFQGLGPRLRHQRVLGSWEDLAFAVMGGRATVSEEDLRAIRAIYWENAAYLDAQLAGLLALDGGFWDRAYLVLVSDHGQMLGEKGELDHLQGLWEPLLRVPLLVRPPGGMGSRRVDHNVSLASLFPLLSRIAAGEPTPLRTWLAEADHAPVFAESRRGIVPYVHSLTHGPASRSLETRKGLVGFSEEHDHPALACVCGPWKLVCHLGRKEDELYDVVKDPNEEANHVSLHPELIDELHDELRKRYLDSGAGGETKAAAPRRDAMPSEAKVDVAQGVLRSAFSGGRRTVLLWTGGKDSTLVLYLALDLVQREGLPVPRTVVVDHGQHFPETWAFLREIVRREGLTLEIARNDALLNTARGTEGTVPFADLDAADQEEALKAGFQGTEVPLSLNTQVGNHLLKTVALNRFLADRGVDTVVTGIRWDENPARATEVFYSPRESPSHMRVHPILPWTERDVWDYTLSKGLPFHPLYRVGYRSLDGVFDSRPTDSRPAWEQDLEGTPERAGRAQDKESIMVRLRALGYF